MKQARPYAKAIANAVTNRTMPPWHAEAPAGTFHNERSLSDLERDTLTAWAAGGAINGDPKDLPAQPTVSDGWSLGKPDVVLDMLEDYPVAAKGTIQYEWFYIPTNFTEAKWVKSIEVRPGNRAAVHHVLVYYRATPDRKVPPIARSNQTHQSNPPPEEKGVAERPRRTDLQAMPPRLIATYAPGTNPQVAPAGTAFRLEPGGIIELQMHYTATGQPATDRTKIGITFSTEASPREVRAQHFMNVTMKLPAGAADVAVTTDLEFLQDATVWGLFPHTHLRGKRWAYTLAAAERRNEIDPLGAAVRLQLADVLHVQGAAAGAQGCEDCLDGLVRQLTSEQEQSRSEGRRHVGRSDVAGDAVHGSPVKRELIDWQIGRLADCCQIIDFRL